MQLKFPALFFPAFLILISLFLAFKNYTPGTFLTGWDTLHPEFNFSLNLERVIFGVFRDEQGLGAVAGHSHMAEIPRIIILFFLSFLLPIEFLRYSWIFLCLVLGPLGVYFFLQRIGRIPAFLGSLFYLLNLGTLQHFYVPFEMFPTQFAALPFLFFFAIRFIESKKTKFLVAFSITTLLSTPMAYAATLWYAYFLSLSLFLVVYNLFLKDKKILRASIKILIITLLINSFWLLPNLYFIGSHAKEVSESKIHSLFTDEAFAQNASFGTLPNIAIFKNYLFNWGEYIGSDKFGPLLDEWTKHLENPLVSFLGYFFFLLVLLGIFYILKIKNVLAISFLPIFLLCIFFMLNINPPFGFIFQLLQDNIPLLREALRFPFNKFSIIFIFASSLYLAWAVSLLKRPQILLFFLLTLSLIYYMYPAFDGKFISPSMRTKIPQEYMGLFEYFNKEEKGRVAVFPIHSFWGWVYNDWGYQGAGFLWFGIKQSFLDRDFDRWQKYNEQYYREMSHAVYTQDQNLFQKVLSKYNISHVLIDKSVLPAGQDPNVLFLNEIKSLIETSPGIKKEKEFGENLIVYEIDSKENVESDLFILENYNSLSPALTASYEDLTFQKYGHYVSAKDSGDILLPFADLMDNQNKLSGKIAITQDGISLTIPRNAISRPLSVPDFVTSEKLFAVDLMVERKPNTLKVSFIPRFPKSEAPITLEALLPSSEKNFLLSINQANNYILNNPLENTPLTLGTIFLNTNEENTISIYKDADDLSFKPDFSALSFDLKPCQDTENEGVLGITPQDNSFTLYGKDTSVCLTIPLSNMAQGASLGQNVLLGVSFTSSNPSFCVADLSNGNCKNYDSRNILLNRVTLDKTRSFFEVKTSDFGSLGLKFFLDARDEDQKVSYEDVYFTFKRPIFSVSFSKEVELALRSFKIENNTLNIPFSGIEQLSLDITRLPKTGGDCPETPGVVADAKKEIFRKEFENYIRYEASEGSFCDHFSYENLPQDQAYLIVINARNIKGLPARLCIANRTTKRCDIYAHLEKTSEFSDNIFLLPPMKSAQNGFDVNINNFAVKNIPSINDVSSITVIPFPYTFLSQIESAGSKPGPSKVSEITKENVSSPNKSVYALNSNGAKGDLLVLSKSFEGGWKAYQVKDLNLFTKFFPFLGGKELKNHVLVDNWANGWILEGESPRLVILFLPQYLEYLGFLLTFGSFAYFFKR